VIAVQRTGKGDAMIEADSNNSNQNAVPRQDMVVSNATFIQRDGGSDLATILIRGGADYVLLNSVVYAPNYACLRLSQSETVQTSGTDENGPPVFESVVMTCNDAFITVDADDDFNESVVADIFNDGSNNSSTFTSTLTSTFVNGANENAVAVFNPTSYSAFFENPSNIGAVFPGNTTWYQTWTCNSAAANLNGATNCAASPVT